MTTIVTTSPGFAKQGPVAARIAEKGWTLIRCADTSKPDGGVGEHLGEADFLVVGLVAVTAASLTGITRLKGVLKNGVGVDNIDIKACTAHGLPVMNTPGANADAVAEHALALMFALARNIPAGHNSVMAGGWDRKVGTQLGGKVLGIVGLGNIGRKLALKAVGLGMSVIATDPYADMAFAKQLGIEITELDDVLARADYVSLHVFGGAQNASLINTARIAKMKPGACLLNLARGEVVDLDAVAEALESGQLGGVGLDAYPSEPPDTAHPVFRHPRAVFTPHSGADTRESVDNMGFMVLDDIETILAGGMPARCLNKKELEDQP